MSINIFLNTTLSDGDDTEIPQETVARLRETLMKEVSFQYRWSKRTIHQFILPQVDDEDGHQKIWSEKEGKLYWNNAEWHIANRYKRNFLMNAEYYLPPVLLWTRPEVAMSAGLITLVKELVGLQDLRHIRHYIIKTRGLNGLLNKYWKLVQKAYTSGCTSEQIPIEVKQEAFLSGIELLLQDIKRTGNLPNRPSPTLEVLNSIGIMVSYENEDLEETPEATAIIAQHAARKNTPSLMSDIIAARTCPLCGTPAANKEMLIEHKQILCRRQEELTKNKYVRCHECDVQYDNLTEMARHAITFCKETMGDICTACGKTRPLCPCRTNSKKSWHIMTNLIMQPSEKLYKLDLDGILSAHMIKMYRERLRNGTVTDLEETYTAEPRVVTTDEWAKIANELDLPKLVEEHIMTSAYSYRINELLTEAQQHHHIGSTEGQTPPRHTSTPQTPRTSPMNITGITSIVNKETEQEIHPQSSLIENQSTEGHKTHLSGTPSTSETPSNHSDDIITQRPSIVGRGLGPQSRTLQNQPRLQTQSLPTSGGRQPLADIHGIDRHVTFHHFDGTENQIPSAPPHPTILDPPTSTAPTTPAGPPPNHLETQHPPSCQPILQGGADTNSTHTSNQRLINDQIYNNRIRKLNEEIQMYREENLRLSLLEEQDKYEEMRQRHGKGKTSIPPTGTQVRDKPSAPAAQNFTGYQTHGIYTDQQKGVAQDGTQATHGEEDEIMQQEHGNKGQQKEHYEPGNKDHQKGHDECSQTNQQSKPNSQPKPRATQTGKEEQYSDKDKPKCKNESHKPPMEFETELEKIRHIASTHKCPYSQGDPKCGYFTEMDKDMLTHIETNHKQKEEKIRCKLCSSSFSTTSAREIHIRNCHPECSSCGQHFEGPEQLYGHNKPTPCNKLDKIQEEPLGRKDGKGNLDTTDIGLTQQTIKQHRDGMPDPSNALALSLAKLVDTVELPEIEKTNIKGNIRSWCALQNSNAKVIAFPHKSRLNNLLLIQPPSFGVGGKEQTNRIKDFISQGTKWKPSLQSRDAFSNYLSLAQIVEEISNAVAACNLTQQTAVALLMQKLDTETIRSLEARAGGDCRTLSFQTILLTAQQLYFVMDLKDIKSIAMNLKKEPTEMFLQFHTRAYQILKLAGLGMSGPDRNEFIETNMRRLLLRAISPALKAQIEDLQNRTGEIYTAADIVDTYKSSELINDRESTGEIVHDSILSAYSIQQAKEETPTKIHAIENRESDIHRAQGQQNTQRDMKNQYTQHSPFTPQYGTGPQGQPQGGYFGQFPDNRQRNTFNTPIHQASDLMRPPQGRYPPLKEHSKKAILGISNDMGPLCFRCGKGIHNPSEFHREKDCDLKPSNNIHECGNIAGHILHLFHEPDQCPFKENNHLRRIRLT